ncbi:MAG: hypothetical protein ACFFER_09310, partial [Candidatus Thorarchaeota archaeon]
KPQAVIYALVLDCTTVMRIPMERNPPPVEGIFYCMNESPAGQLIGCHILMLKQQHVQVVLEVHFLSISCDRGIEIWTYYCWNQ